MRRYLFQCNKMTPPLTLCEVVMNFQKIEEIPNKKMFIIVECILIKIRMHCNKSYFLGMSRSHGKFRAISFKLLLCCMVALNLKGISSFLSALNIPRTDTNMSVHGLPIAVGFRVR